MKWTTFLFLLVLQYGFSQSHVAFLKTLGTPSSTPSISTNADAVLSPIHLVRGMAFVNARLDDQEGRYLLDTGAPMLVMNSKMEATKADIPAASFSTSFNLGSTKVKNFRWANIQRKNLEALVLDIQHLETATNSRIAGIVGYDILKNVELFLDYPQKQVLLLPPGNNKVHKAAKPLATLDFELQQHLPVITIQIGNRTLRFGLDTGAGVNLLDEACKNDLPAEIFVSLGIEEIRSIDKNSKQVEGTLINQVQVAGFPLDAMKFLFTELHDLEVTSAIQIDGLLGFPFFERVKCSIDYPNMKLHIWSVVK